MIKFAQSSMFYRRKLMRMSQKSGWGARRLSSLLLLLVRRAFHVIDILSLLITGWTRWSLFVAGQFFSPRCSFWWPRTDCGSGMGMGKLETRETFAELSRKLSINAMQVEQNRTLLFGCNEMLFVPYLADDKNIFRWHWNEFQISSLNIYPGPRITAVFLSQCPCPPITILAVNHQPNNWITSS